LNPRPSEKAIAEGQGRFREKEKILLLLREEKEAIVQKIRSRSESLKEIEGSSKMLPAKVAPKKVTTKVDAVAAKTSMEKIGRLTQANKGKSVGRLDRIVDKIEDILDVEHIKLAGNLRRFVMHGCLLSA
jgi:hypothetical protein